MIPQNHWTESGLWGDEDTPTVVVQVDDLTIRYVRGIYEPTGGWENA